MRGPSNWIARNFRQLSFIPRSPKNEYYFFFELKFKFCKMKLMLIFAKLRKIGVSAVEEDTAFRLRKYLYCKIQRRLGMGLHF